MGSTSEADIPADLLEDHRIAVELKASQAAFEHVSTIRNRRTKAVDAAVARQWPVARIARVMEVDPATVRAILAAAQKKDPTP